MSLDELMTRLQEISRIGNERWLASLNERKLKELEFHDRDRDSEFVKSAIENQDTYERFYGNRKYYQATGASKKYVIEWIKTHSPGKVFLDYACGNGENAMRAAQNGAILSIGIDISSVSVRNAQEAAEQRGLNNCRFIQADCENTQLPNNSIDVIICSGMLHHLDLSYAFPEMRRILKPGGIILAVEALDHNPLIKLYRHLTPQMRTEWEKNHILSMRDIRFAKRFYEVKNVRFWHIMTILAPKVSLRLLHPFEIFDKILTNIPGIRLMCWIFTFELKKRD